MVSEHINDGQRIFVPKEAEDLAERVAWPPLRWRSPFRVDPVSLQSDSWARTSAFVDEALAALAD